MLKFIFKILFFLVVSLPVLGQGKKFIPKSVSASFDLGNYAYSRIIDGVDFKEYSADLQVYRFYLTGDYGYARLSQNEAYYNYSSEGNYFRVGFDYNFIKKKNNPNVIFLGLRYAQNKFDEHLNYSTNNGIETDGIWPEEEISIHNQEVTGNWVELVGGLKVDVFKGLQLGFTGRYKIIPRIDGESSFSNYYLPGYGKRLRKTNWGISYYIGYRIRFGK